MLASDFFHLFIALLCGHFLCDFPLQGDFLARAKNHTAPLPGVPWYVALAAHAAIHGAMVWLLTGSLLLGTFEYACHVAIDYAKCAGWYGFEEDQVLHFATKLVIVVTLFAFTH